jgi:hypothetical protein
VPKVTLKTLRDDVISAAKAAAEESCESHDGAMPPEGTSTIVTEADRRLWQAARRLRRWEISKKKR